MQGWWFSCSVGMASSGSGLFDVDVVVLDEVHYLSDIYRGTVWEEIVSAYFTHLWLRFFSAYIYICTTYFKQSQIISGYLLS